MTNEAEQKNLSRTAAALAAYDEFDANFEPEQLDQPEVTKGFAKLEELGKSVGVMFGHDTSQHAPKTGPFNLKGLDFVRSAVARWKSGSPCLIKRP